MKKLHKSTQKERLNLSRRVWQSLIEFLYSNYVLKNTQKLANRERKYILKEQT